MKIQWLNSILLLTNRIHGKKQNVIRQSGIKIISDVFALIFLEIALAIISLPLYLGIKTTNVTAYLEKEGGYSKIAFDYSARKILTLTGVSLVLFIWSIKLVLIILIPSIYGPLQLYSISDLKPVDVMSESIPFVGVPIESAIAVKTIPMSKLENIKKVSGGDYIFYGKGEPSLDLVLLLSGKETVIYSEQIGEDGSWQIKHLQERFKLSPGNYSVMTFNYDRNLNVRGDISSEKFFRVEISWLDKLVSNVDILTNWFIAFFIIIGVVLIFLII